MVEMRFPLGLAPLALAALAGALSSGCAHTLESSREDRVVIAVDNNQARSAESTTEVTQAPPMIVAEPAPTRPRLSQTVTLGQGTVEPVYAQPAPQYAPYAQGANGANVVVNNNITVVGAPPVVYGGYGYGYGYGGYGGGYRAREGYGQSTGSASRAPGYAPSGWEGAGRTAAPGQTPHVGGNWSPAPSHGPRQMR